MYVQEYDVITSQTKTQLQKVILPTAMPGLKVLDLSINVFIQYVRFQSNFFFLIQEDSRF